MSKSKKKLVGIKKKKSHLDKLADQLVDQHIKNEQLSKYKLSRKLFDKL